MLWRCDMCIPRYYIEMFEEAVRQSGVFEHDYEREYQALLRQHGVDPRLPSPLLLRNTWVTGTSPRTNLPRRARLVH